VNGRRGGTASGGRTQRRARDGWDVRSFLSHSPSLTVSAALAEGALRALNRQTRHFI
jgi:hypothetical protein